MKKLLTTLCLVITIISGPVAPVAAEDAIVPPPDYAVIAAIQTGQIGANGNDFVEVYNPTNNPIDVTGWKLQYRSATATGNASWTTKRTIACAAGSVSPCQVMLPAKSSLVFSTYAIANIPSQPVSSGFGDAGGQLRLLSADAIVQDLVGYGTAAEAEGGKAAPAAPLGQVLLRKVADGQVVDSNNNGDDFVVGCYQPVPRGEIMPMQPPAPIACPDTEDPASDNAVTANPTSPSEPTQPIDDTITAQTQAYAPLLITELFPDPASPQTDSDDEFIELFNPTSEPVDAAGYVLETGSDFRYHFTLGDDITIAAGGYTTITSASSHLSLTNTGTAVRLLDPSGRVIDEVANYGQAKSAQTWSKINGVWQWTTSPTPGAANVLSIPAAAAAATTATKKTTTTKSTAKTTATKAPKATTTTSKGGTKTAASIAPSTTGNEQPESGDQSYLLLLPIGLLAGGYIIYEYRKDIAKMYRKLTGKLPNKKTAEEPTLQMD